RHPAWAGIRVVPSPRGRVAATPAPETAGGRPSSVPHRAVTAVVPAMAVEAVPVQARVQAVRPARNAPTRAQDVESSKAGKTPPRKATWGAVAPGGVLRGNGVNFGPPTG